MSFKKHLIPIETSFGTGKVDVPIDPATLASEVIEHVYRTGSVAREPGFAVYLTSTIGDKVWRHAVLCLWFGLCASPDLVVFVPSLCRLEAATTMCLMQSLPKSGACRVL